jgi:flagellar biosynthesis chaperone FliJ
VVAAARKHGKLPGINPRTSEQADEWMAVGFKATSWGNDVAVYFSALSTAIQSLRKTAAQLEARPEEAAQVNKRKSSTPAWQVYNLWSPRVV